MEYSELLKEVNRPCGTKTEAEIRRAAAKRRLNPNPKKYHPHGGERDTYISPNYGDGAWHATPGTEQFTTEWEPRNDRILVRLFPEKLLYPTIARPETAAKENLTRIGEVLKVGPGKWIPGEWWNVVVSYENPEYLLDPEREWRWFPGHRSPLTVRPGMHVAIGKWTDWESADAGWGENIVLCQEADVRAIL